MRHRASLVAIAAAAALCAAGGCGFSPDLTRFHPCDAEDRCGVGLTCVLPDRRCVPDCLDCEPEPPDAAEDAGSDAGEDDAGHDGGAEDAGGALFVAQRLPHGVEGAPYEAAVFVDGGTAPYTFEAVPSSIPAPLTLATDGVLSGTPAQYGAFVLRMSVRDASTRPLVADASVDWDVHPALRLGGPMLLAEWPTSGTHSETVFAYGGLPPYRFEVVDGGFPGEITLAPEGIVTGSIAAATTATVTVSVRDSAVPPQEATGLLDFSSSASGVAIRVLTRELPTGRVGFAYDYRLKAHSGTPPYTWTREAGTLPFGMTFDASGRLSGTPTQAGNFALTFSVRDDLLTAVEDIRFDLIIEQ